MSTPRHIFRRGKIYYARIATPKDLLDLREAAGGPRGPLEKTTSLRTEVLREAQTRGHEFLALQRRAFDKEMADLRADLVAARRTQPTLRQPTTSDLQDLRSRFFARELHLDTQERLSRKSAAELEQMKETLIASYGGMAPHPVLGYLGVPGFLELEVARDKAAIETEKREILESELRKQLAAGDHVLVHSILQEEALALGLDLDPRSQPFKALARGLTEAWIKSLQVAKGRDTGKTDEELGVAEDVNGLVSGPAAEVIPLPVLPKVSAVEPGKGERLLDYFDAFWKEQKKGKSHSAYQDSLATVRQFVECCGDRRVTEYTKSDTASYKKLLSQSPANMKKLYPSLTIKQAVERNHKDGHPLLSKGSIRSKLSHLSVFGKWLAENVDGVDADSFATSMPRRDDRERMDPFSDEQVCQILNSHAFVGAKSAKDYSQPGDFRLRDWHFWLTLIAAFTGARLNEIAQLEVSDLRQEDGVWAFDVTDEGPGRSLKNKNSKRKIPVHPRLIELGLLAYRDSVIAAGGTSLLHGAVPDGRGRRSTSAGKWFRKFLVKLGIKVDGELGGIHRWRHTVTDALRRAGVDGYNISLILGHELDIGRMTRDYGREAELSLAARHKLMSKVDYPAVDFQLIAPVQAGDT